jgi:hypothetical protein
VSSTTSGSGAVEGIVEFAGCGCSCPVPNLLVPGDLAVPERQAGLECRRSGFYIVVAFRAPDRTVRGRAMAELTVMTCNVQNLLPVGHNDGPATVEE